MNHPITSHTEADTISETAMHSEYSEIKKRVKTFKKWPQAMNQTPENLAEAGFFYTNKGDEVKCFFCGGSLKQWKAEEQPWIEHTKWFPECYFVLFCKGEDFIKEIIESRTTEISETKERKEENQEDTCTIPSALLCKMCYAYELEIVFLPCSHLVACTRCAVKMTECSVCRGEISHFISVSIPKKDAKKIIDANLLEWRQTKGKGKEFN